MHVEKLPRVKTTLRPSNHPYMSGPWTPQHDEVNASELEVIEGEIPKDIDGIYLRNTENPVHQPIGRPHPFDGDGMIHQIAFSEGRATYRNRFVRTRCFEAEQIEGGALWGGLADGPGVSKRPGYGAKGDLKDAASTDIVVHAGKAIATFYQCGEGYVLDPETLDNEGVAPWVPIDGISAHPKVDEATGELLFFNYSKHPPYMHYGVVDADGKLKTYIPVPLPGPRLPHDMTFSANWAILNDLPVFWDAELMKHRNLHAVRLHKGVPSRFALIPRNGNPDEIRWFEAEPTYVLHWLNAYEEGDEVILDGYFQENPTPRPEGFEEHGEHAHMMAFLDGHSLGTKLHRWRFNLADGTTKEERLDDRTVEFGMINQKFAGRKYRYVYSTVAKPGWFLFEGFVKHDLETGEGIELKLDQGRYASEAPFAPRIGSTEEDDGYLVSFIIDENEGTSECVLIDCKKFEEGPVCRIALPHKLSSGTHSTWVDSETLDAAKVRKREALAA
ncbi:carotenoid oxygenase family protein [Alteriqipengyuania lutimaris]|uniref:Dioxygenase n=1 Tax=Alteriqipengyuania lutimaris TaxID=1538146 RepID=A0A395LKU2_9SPHN|nr:carotenoid oxygenase family protein [Alteriqipengyuania lutimaris]MBB3033705.1 carotenoid cleavage dioxygenase [Alteriqipengyuania lutimaris]RDS77309.1 apocarotenoid-15,15'-oxygenase [Alteriqipengyuania lutimaris]